MALPKLAFLNDLIEAINHSDWWAGSGRKSSADALSGPPAERLAAACEVLTGRIGDAARVAIAEQALLAYGSLNDAERIAFFHLLRDSYGADPAQIRSAYTAWDQAPSAATLPALSAAVEPRRQDLFRRLNMAPGATLRLVQMRADLLKAIRSDETLQPLDYDFAHLLHSWFNRGFLTMQRIDWHSPAAVLEKIMAYETVHPMTDWNDLHRRLDANDRRLYAFFHPATGDEPLIFVEVALTKGVPEKIADIIEAPQITSPSQGDTAVFYSINNTLSGLKGISFGNFLIKQVVADLSVQLPQLKTFVTLSPAPGFAAWLKRQDNDHEKALGERLEAEKWLTDAEEAVRLRPEVERAAARYVVQAKGKRQLPEDPVARFHLGNGASAWRVNWPADVSPGARQRAFGLMINYLYEPARIYAQHEAYMREGTVAHGPQLTQLLKP